MTIIEFTVFILKNVLDCVKLPLNVSKHSKIYHNYYDITRLLPLTIIVRA